MSDIPGGLPEPSPALWPAPETRPHGSFLDDLAAPALFAISLVALPCFLVSPWLGGSAALLTIVASSIFLARHVPRPALLTAAICIGAVGVALAILSVMLVVVGFDVSPPTVS